MMYHHNIIPPSYRSWREVWQSASTIHLPGNKMFAVNNDTDTWIIDIDFIKARCFDEIEPNLPTPEDIYNLRGTMITRVGMSALEKVSNLSTVKYKT